MRVTFSKIGDRDVEFFCCSCRHGEVYVLYVELREWLSYRKIDEAYIMMWHLASGPYITESLLRYQ